MLPSNVGWRIARDSPRWELIDKAARSSSAVLIIGESGVGKDVAVSEIQLKASREDISRMWRGAAFSRYQPRFLTHSPPTAEIDRF